MPDLLPRDATGKLVDFLDPEVRLDAKPEELVRQRLLRILHHDYGYAKDVLAREVPIQRGGKDALDAAGRPIRADVVVYETAAACRSRDPARIRLIGECRAANQEGGHDQLASYLFSTRAEGAVWFNGSGTSAEAAYFRRTGDTLVPWVGMPRPKESWDALGRRARQDLARARDIKGLLRRCHNKLHARGAASDEEDLTLDMVRILMAKAMDELSEGALPQFYCTPEEYQGEQGRHTAAARVRALFEHARSTYPGVFRPEERITVDDRAICEVVGELQSFRLLADDATSDEWDVMGHAYEEYTAVSLKRRRGQFFTNRLVVDLLVRMVDPRFDDLVLDPAGGSAGFLSGALRHVRRDVSGASPEVARTRLRHFRQRLHMVEVSHRLVKVARTAMILHGDGYAGMTQGDALGPFDTLDPHLRAVCGEGMASVVLTNPPFAGVGDGRITDQRVLERFECGFRWAERNGRYGPTTEPLAEGAPPELLFFERCVRWLAPGGRLGIVLPKSFLDTATYKSGRAVLFRDCKLLAVINCHKNTFQPHTGVRTALLVVQRRVPGERPDADPPVFMALSRSVGQDSEGAPVFARDSAGMLTDTLDEDVSLVAADWQRHVRGALVPSEYRFSIPRSAIDEGTLNVNPQAHRPSLNATIAALQALDDTPGWTVSRLEELVGDGEIFKGPRFKSENMIVEADEAMLPDVEAYYTPTAVLQERKDSAKLFALRRATKAQLTAIAAIRVRLGDIVITRSGTIGRVAIITSLFDNAIVSDDFVRVRVPDERMRLYLWAFLETRLAHDQIMKNEYGAIQQHLEPEHVRELLVPVPTDPAALDAVVTSRRAMLAAKEQLLAADTTSHHVVRALFSGIGSA